MASNVSQEDVEKMRAIVANHDKQQSPKSFDINNPPKEQYVHQDFPRLVYHKNYQHGHDENGRALTAKNPKHVQTANSEAELKELLKKGYQLDPPMPEADEADEMEEVEQNDEEQAEAPAARKRGRNKSAEEAN